MQDDIEKAIQRLKLGFNQINRRVSPQHNMALLNISKGIDAVEAHAARSGWVAIDDIPEEWKNGRPVDLWVVKDNIEPFRLNDCRYKKRPILEGYSHWKSWNYALKEGEAKFAMLPPPPPQLKVGE